MGDTSQQIPELDRRGLRRFGLMTGAIVAVLFGLFFPWLLDIETPQWPWLLAGLLAAWALVAPGTLNLVYRGWMRFGLLMSRVTTPLILGAVFFLVFFPTAIVLRMLGKDPMHRKLDEHATSYRVSSHKPRRENMERPF